MTKKITTAMKLAMTTKSQDAVDAYAHEQMLRWVVNEINYGCILLKMMYGESRKARIQATLDDNRAYLMELAISAKVFLVKEYVELIQGETNRCTTLGQCLAEAQRISAMIPLASNQYMKPRRSKAKV